MWYGPVVRRWIAEQQTLLPTTDGGALAAQPYVDERWLTHHLLGFSSQARLLAPPEAVADMRATIRRILDLYEL